MSVRILKLAEMIVDDFGFTNDYKPLALIVHEYLTVDYLEIIHAPKGFHSAQNPLAKMEFLLSLWLVSYLNLKAWSLNVFSFTNLSACKDETNDDFLPLVPFIYSL